MRPLFGTACAAIDWVNLKPRARPYWSVVVESGEPGPLADIADAPAFKRRLARSESRAFNFAQRMF